MAQSTIRVEPIAGALGAEISGVDLSRDLSEAAIGDIRAALLEHQVVFFRDQQLTPEQHLDFGRRFGKLQVHEFVGGMAAYPEILEVRKEPGETRNFGVKDKDSYPSADHPVVRTHPVTGKKALYVNKGFTRRINGIPLDESDGILRYLFEHMQNPLFQCRFRWQPNSLAFWDNRCVQHHAMWDYWPHTRSGNRVTVKGDRPV